MKNINIPELKIENMNYGDAVAFIRRKRKISKEKAVMVIDKYRKAAENSKQNAEYNVNKANGLAIGSRYTYNENTDTYVVFLKSAGKNVVIQGTMHRAMLDAYSNWSKSPLTINQICRNFSIPRPWFEEYKTIMGWTHDHEPVSKEKILTSDIEAISDDILQEKRFNLYQTFQKKDWKSTQEDAQKWREFKAGTIDPFSGFLKRWETKTANKLPVCKIAGKKSDEKVMVIGLSDIHCGGLAEAKKLNRGKEWNLEVYHNFINKYITNLEDRIKNMVVKPKKIVLLSLGDILHGLLGTTEKGTPLVFDKIKDTQFDNAFNSLINFVESIAKLADVVEVHSVKGNHDGFSGYILFKALAAYFRTEERITFNVPQNTVHLLKVLNTLIVISHGASPEYKAKVPTSGKPRESYIQSLLLANPEKLIGIKQKLFICGDLHSFEQQEANDFEYIRFSSPVTGDHYADNLNLHSRPRQNFLIIDNNGISEVGHVYFD